MRPLFLALVVNAAIAVPAWSLPEGVKQQDELAAELRGGPLAGWKRAWKARDAASFSRLCADKTSLPGWTGRLHLLREKEGIQEFEWTSAESKALGRAEVAKAAGAYLGDYSAIDDVELVLTDLSSEPGSPAASLDIGYSLRGRLKDGSLRTDRGTLEVSVRREGSAWKISRILDRGMETLQAKKPVFEDATSSLGLSEVERHARLEAIRRGGYALAVTDDDGSGWPSVYVGGYGKAQLYRRTADGRYRDATKESGLGEDTLVKSAVFADFDNDGKVDLLAQRFVEQAGQELKFYRNSGGGRFVEAQASVDRKVEHDRAMSMTAADFNDDGLIDLYVGYPGTRDFTDGRIDAPGSLAHQAVYMNRGGMRFEEVLEASVPRLSQEVVRPHSALSLDLDADGKRDILVVDDRGNSSKIYLNKGNERFQSGELQLGLQNQGWGMVAVAGDFDRDQKEDIYFTNIDFSAGRLVRRLLEKAGASPKTDPGLARIKNLFTGSRLYRAAGASGFREATQGAGVGWTGEAAAGAAWVDYNNDGHLDLYVANGLWSADPEKSFDEQFVRDVVDGTQPDSSESDNPVMRRLQKTGESFGGYQRNRLYRNNGDGSFTEVGYVAGADRIEDGYVVAQADIDKDGRADLILRNADPADLKYGMLPLTVLRNRGANDYRSLAVYPRNKAGAPAFGARVVVHVGDAAQVREIRSVEGAVQSEAMAFVGLGAAGKADRMEVHWPSGKVSSFENVQAGRITVDESGSGPERLTRR